MQKKLYTGKASKNICTRCERNNLAHFNERNIRHEDKHYERIILKYSILSFDWSNNKDKFLLHFRYTKFKISKRIRWLNNQINIQTNLRTKTTVVCIRHCTFVLYLFCLWFVRHCLYSYCVSVYEVYLPKRFIHTERNKWISLQVLDGTIFLTSTFFFRQDQFHLFMVSISRLMGSLSRVTILDILVQSCEGGGVKNYHILGEEWNPQSTPRKHWIIFERKEITQ